MKACQLNYFNNVHFNIVNVSFLFALQKYLHVELKAQGRSPLQCANDILDEQSPVDTEGLVTLINMLDVSHISLINLG